MEEALKMREKEKERMANPSENVVDENVVDENVEDDDEGEENGEESSSEEEDEEFSLVKFFKRTAVLPLLPIERVSDAWSYLIDSIPENDDRLETFHNYVTSTWIEGDNAFSMYLWNHFNTDDARTNNNVEGCNLGMKKEWGTDLNLWKFIKALKNLEYDERIRY